MLLLVIIATVAFAVAVGFLRIHIPIIKIQRFESILKYIYQKNL